MGNRLPWILFVASLLLNAVFLAGAVFGWATLKAPFQADSPGLAVVKEELSLSPEQAEIRRLKEENRRLKMEKDILKKATVFFAKETK